MLNIDLKQKVFLAKGVTDLIKSINGLSIIVEQDFTLNPYDRNLYVFCNRNIKNSAAIIYKVED